MAYQVFHEACPCCGSDQLDIAHPDKRFYVEQISTIILYSYRLCRFCGHYFVLNPLSPENIDRYYQNSEQMRRDYVSDIEMEVFRKQTDFLEDSLSLRSSSVLEVGCDTGQFLDYLVRFFRCTTYYLESSSRARAIIDSTGRHLDILTADADPVDVIVARHVLEHVADPVGFLRFLMDYGNKDAQIMIEVPDLSDFGPGADGVYFEHLHYFSVSSLAKALENAGLRIKKLEVDQTDGYGTTENRVLRVIASRRYESGICRRESLEHHFRCVNSNLYQSVTYLCREYEGKVALYPASWISRDIILNTEEPETLFMAVYDGDDTKWGKAFHSFVVAQPQHISESQVECVVVTSSYYKEITEALSKTGFNGRIVYYMDLISM